MFWMRSSIYDGRCPEPFASAAPLRGSGNHLYTWRKKNTGETRVLLSGECPLSACQIKAEIRNGVRRPRVYCIIIRDEKYVDTAGNNKGAYLLEKNGIIVVVSKIRFYDKEQFVLTGYENTDKTEEATGAIQTVIARYGYTPEFSYVRRQVGAVITSLVLSHNTVKKSSSRIASKLIEPKRGRFLKTKT
ncbi:MAG: hypothetical protein LBK73_01845 [Treponema sp.]|jgi:uncharacterized protein YkuJ|nr:hypothetical protein [Treponema sp.]